MSYVGFAFQSYVGPWQESGGSWAADAWSAYSEEVVQSLLGALLGQGINMVSTYGNGYSAYGGVVSQTDSNQYILPSASSLGMTVVAGANQWLDATQPSGWNLAVTESDITSTLEFAKQHPEVVIGLNITNEAIESGTSTSDEAQFAENVYTLVQYAINQLPNYGFQNTDPTNAATFMPISIRESQGILCGVSQGQSYSSTLLQILQSVNLVYANIYPYGFTYNLGASPTQSEFQKYVSSQLSAYYQAIVSSFSAVGLGNLPICIGETGWATQGVNATNPSLPTSVELAQWNYAAVVDWAISKQITTFVFEAFDEPFKSGLPGSPPSAPTYSGSDQAFFGVFQAQGQVPSSDYPYNQTNNYSLSGTVQQYCYLNVGAGWLLSQAAD